MIEKLKKIRLHVTFSALLTIALGVVILMKPTATVLWIAKAVGVIILIVGAVMIIGSLFDSKKLQPSGIVVGGIIAVIGLWVLMRPTRAASIIPAVIGVIMILQGVEDLEMAFKTKRASARWALSLLIGVANIIFGVLCITKGIGIISFGMMVVGAMLIFDGLSSIFVVHRANSAERGIIIDVEADDF